MMYCHKCNISVIMVSGVTSVCVSWPPLSLCHQVPRVLQEELCWASSALWFQGRCRERAVCPAANSLLQRHTARSVEHTHPCVSAQAEDKHRETQKEFQVLTQTSSLLVNSRNIGRFQCLCSAPRVKKKDILNLSNNNDEISLMSWHWNEREAGGKRRGRLVIVWTVNHVKCHESNQTCYLHLPGY